MPKIWPQDTIRELLALAETLGEASASLGSAREAELFRFAIYSFRKDHCVGQNLSVTIDGKTVVLTKREEHKIVVNHKESINL